MAAKCKIFVTHLTLHRYKDVNQIVDLQEGKYIAEIYLAAAIFPNQCMRLLQIRVEIIYNKLMGFKLGNT